MKKCFVVIQKLRLTTGYINVPVSVHLDRESAQQEIYLLNSESPLEAWINKVPFHDEFIVKGTEMGRAPGVPSREEMYEHLVEATRPQIAKQGASDA